MVKLVSDSPIVLASLGGALVFAAAAGAQDSPRYPDRSIRLIVPFAPGGQTDIVSRRLGAKIANVIGQQMVIDNRAGGAGIIGTVEAARAKPDGYTLLTATSTTHGLNPTAKIGLPYDAVKDFAPIALLGTGPIVVSVHPSVPARALGHLIADVKAKPGQYSFGSSGMGSINHLAGELFKLRAGRLEIVHVPYKGSGASVQDLVAGQIPMTLAALSGVLPHHRAGRVRTLAVASEKRSPAEPGIPTMKEAGVEDMLAYAFSMLLAPAGTPREIIERLHVAVAKVMGDRAFADDLIKLGVDPPVDATPEKAAAMIQSEIAKWAPLIESLGLRQR